MVDNFVDIMGQSNATKRFPSLITDADKAWLEIWPLSVEFCQNKLYSLKDFVYLHLLLYHYRWLCRPCRLKRKHVMVDFQWHTNSRAKQAPLLELLNFTPWKFLFYLHLLLYHYRWLCRPCRACMTQEKACHGWFSTDMLDMSVVIVDM